MVAAAQRKQFDALDTTRGVAALTVALFHFSGGWKGYLAVDFFLVLSGFILSHSYLYSNRKLSGGRFIWLRICRMYPLHIFTLGTYAAAKVFTGSGIPSFSGGNEFTLLLQFFMMHNIGLNPGGLSWNYPSWTISAEFWINLGFFYFITKNVRSATLFSFALIIIVFIFNKSGHLDIHAGNYYGFINSGLLRCLASFLLGVVAYRVYLNINLDRVNTIWFHSLEVMLVVALFFIVSEKVGDYKQFECISPLVFCVFVWLYSLERGFLSRALQKFRFFGAISYSVYLNQITVIILFRWLTHDWQLSFYSSVLLFLTALCIYSSLTYYLVERLAQNKLRAIGAAKPQSHA